MANIKTREQIEARQAFIEGTKKDDWKMVNWSPKSLKGLSLEQLEDNWQAIEHQLDSITDQGRLMIWFILKNIRDKFKSDKLFGQHCQELLEKNPTHAVGVTTQQTRNKWINAARWCDKVNIYSLPEVKISQTAVFLLSSPSIPYEDSKKIFKEIKGKNSPVSEIERLINQYKAITVEQTVERIEYDQSESTPLRTVPVERNIALEAMPMYQETINEPPAQDLTALNRHSEDSQEEDYLAKVIRARIHMLLDMPKLDSNMLTQEQMIKEILLLTKHYYLSEIKLIPVLQEAIRTLQGAMWKKPS